MHSTKVTMGTLAWSICLSLTTVLALAGCSSSNNVKKEVPPTPPSAPAKPDLTVRVACIDLGNVRKKIEQADVDKVAAIMKRENIDVAAVEGIARYPDLKNRLDVVAELSTRTGMRQAFGENVTVSGRQTGNAVLANFPILSSVTTPYAGIQSTGFESALQATIDCGVRNVVVVSTRLPENATSDDQKACVSLIASFPSTYEDQPVIVGGTLPQSRDLRAGTGFDEARKGDSSPSFWYTKNSSLRISSTSVVTTPLGFMTVFEFGLFRKPSP